MEKQLITLILVVYPHPEKVNSYPIERGSGLFISCQAFGDASFKISRTSFHAFLYNNLTVDFGHGEATNHHNEKKHYCF